MASEKALLESEISRVRDIRHMRREKEMLEKKIREKKSLKQLKKRRIKKIRKKITVIQRILISRRAKSNGTKVH